ncbi:MAG: helix-turn-helix domain-containing protein [Candidatus Bathyarchaeota archaeon]|nr:helix-turn-helix domain-containing protein [Candidatus Bathyarchaeota archaeon]
MDSPRFMRVAEAAEHLRVGRDTVRHWLNTGYLEGEKVGRQWQIPVDSEGLPRINIFVGCPDALKVLWTPGGNYCPMVHVNAQDKEARQKVIKRTKELEKRGWKKVGGIFTFPSRKAPEGSKHCPMEPHVIQVMECTPAQFEESKDYQGEKDARNSV